MLVPAAIITGIVQLIRSCTDSSSEEDVVEIKVISPEMLRHDSLVAVRLDSLMNIPQRLDTSLIAISVYDATSGLEVYHRHSDNMLPPASCMKIATALTAIETLGLDHRFSESISIRGTQIGDTLHGNVLFRADADPLLEWFEDLMTDFKKTGIRHIDGNVYFDLEKVDTLRPHPSAKTWDIPINRLTPLLKGKNFIERTFLYSLKANGITYRQNPAVKPTGKYRVVAQSSHLLRDVITPMLIHSSNIKAETVFYHLDYKAGIIKDHRQHWDTTHAVEQYLASKFGLVTASDSAAVASMSADMEQKWAMGMIKDGSGLSPQNRLTADFLVELLKYAYEKPQIRDYLINEALASPCDAERRGSLLSRMSRPEYANRVFVKTGTMTTIGASSLSGYIHAMDGHWYIFSIINSDSPVAESRIFQDKFCKTLIGI